MRRTLHIPTELGAPKVKIAPLSRLLALPFVLAAAIAMAQITPVDSPAGAPVSYASVSQLNTLLSQLEQTSQSTQTDLGKLRIEKWKIDSNSKKEAQSNVESIRRNLQGALPTMITELRASPENLKATFKLYRNLNVLYDVFATIVESAGAFGGKDEYQSLGNDFGTLESTRRALADRLDTLTGAKEDELTRLRAQVKTLQAAVPPPQPKKIIVDDTEPAKPAPKPKKKAVPKPTTPAATAPAAPAPK